MSQLAGWVGQEAGGFGCLVYRRSGGAGAEPGGNADRTVLVVRDAQGNTVSREEMPVSASFTNGWAAMPRVIHCPRALRPDAGKLA